MMDELALRQLAALGRVGRLLADAGIDYWLFGGWAVDFYVGSVTRAHDDLDVAVWLADVSRIEELLRGDGWRHAPAPGEDGGTGYERGAVRLELTYLVPDPQHRVVTPLNDGSFRWPENAFASDVRELGGVRARLVALPALVLTKSTPRSDSAEAAKDHADLTRLSLLPR